MRIFGSVCFLVLPVKYRSTMLSPSAISDRASLAPRLPNFTRPRFPSQSALNAELMNVAMAANMVAMATRNPWNQAKLPPFQSLLDVKKEPQGLAIGMHDGRRQVTCKGCGQVFRLQRELVNHAIMTRCRNFTCNHCGKDFVRPEYLYQHIRVKHTEPKYRCPHCGHKSATKQNLLLHMNVHENAGGVTQRRYSAPSPRSASSPRGFNPQDLSSYPPATPSSFVSQSSNSLQSPPMQSPPSQLRSPGAQNIQSPLKSRSPQNLTVSPRQTPHDMPSSERTSLTPGLTMGQEKRTEKAFPAMSLKSDLTDSLKSPGLPPMQLSLKPPGLTMQGPLKSPSLSLDSLKSPENLPDLSLKNLTMDSLKSSSLSSAGLSTSLPSMQLPVRTPGLPPMSLPIKTGGVPSMQLPVKSPSLPSMQLPQCLTQQTPSSLQLDIANAMSLPSLQSAIGSVLSSRNDQVMTSQVMTSQMMSQSQAAGLSGLHLSSADAQALQRIASTVLSSNFTPLNLNTTHNAYESLTIPNFDRDEDMELNNLTSNIANITPSNLQTNINANLSSTISNLASSLLPPSSMNHPLLNERANPLEPIDESDIPASLANSRLFSSDSHYSDGHLP